ncbi:hypothetical protein T11_8138 [Trichinella zimbabwensis]|uniref:Uncharacterized protein n=1 Tax=Trichinella zimbabwensis TaxID=268475 RepID=A0A0V1HSV7_9BILA|nr:hypothetical protein T11_8138 [Trichinella zimbabwensis]
MAKAFFASYNVFTRSHILPSNESLSATDKGIEASWLVDISVSPTVVFSSLLLLSRFIASIDQQSRETVMQLESSFLTQTYCTNIYFQIIRGHSVTHGGYLS